MVISKLQRGLDVFAAIGPSGHRNSSRVSSVVENVKHALNYYRRIVAAAVLAFAMPAYAYAAAAHTNKTIVYSTSIQPVTGFGVPYTGRLQIRTSKNGIITGYYRPADNNDFVAVTGGIDGNRVWIDFGRTGSSRFTGSIHDGVISGTIFGADKKPMRFTANDAHIEG